MCKQVRFVVVNTDVGATDEILGGIGIYEEDANHDEILVNVICGCCGSIFEPDEVVVVEKFEHWIDINEEIIGNNHW